MPTTSEKEGESFVLVTFWQQKQHLSVSFCSDKASSSGSDLDLVSFYFFTKFKFAVKRQNENGSSSHKVGVSLQGDGLNKVTSE